MTLQAAAAVSALVLTVCLPGIENAAVFLFQGQVNVLQAFFFCMAVAVNVVFGVFADKDKFVVFSFQADAYTQKIAGNIVAAQIVFYFFWYWAMPCMLCGILASEKYFRFLNSAFFPWLNSDTGRKYPMTRVQHSQGWRSLSVNSISFVMLPLLLR